MCVSECVHVCMYVCMCVSVCLCMNSVDITYSPKSLCVFIEVGFLSSRIPCQRNCLCLLSAGIAGSYYYNFYKGPGDLNCSLHSWAANILSTESSPQLVPGLFGVFWELIFRFQLSSKNLYLSFLFSLPLMLLGSWSKW